MATALHQVTTATSLTRHILHRFHAPQGTSVPNTLHHAQGPISLWQFTHICLSTQRNDLDLQYAYHSGPMSSDSSI